MTSQRVLLFIILGLLSFLLFQSWNSESSPQTQQAQIRQSTVESSQTNEQLIDLSNSVIDLKINLYGGDFVEATLKKYYLATDNKQPVALLEATPNHYFTIITGLTGANGIDTSNSRPQYKVISNELTAAAQVLTLEHSTDSINVEKIISLYKDTYKIKITYRVTNKSSNHISMSSFATLKHDNFSTKTGLFGASAFSGAVLSTKDDNYDKIDFSDIQENKVKPITTNEGWAAIVNHFFLGAIIPDNEGKDFNIFTSNSSGFNYVTLTGHTQVIEPNQTQEIKDTLWVGPKLQDELAEVAPHLNLTVDYGWAWFISKPLFNILSWIHNLIQNWGLTIILLTIIVRGILYPLSRIQFRTQAKMRKVAPEVKLLNERFEGDRMKKAQEMQKLYRKHNINMLSGCFPLIIQMPIFLALFYVFNEAIELRHTGWLWINDLSSPDRFFILPVLNGITLVLMMRMTPMPENMDPLQKKVMTYMPYIFVVFFFFLPAGLVLYYIVSNVLTIIMIKYNFWRVDQEYKNGKAFAQHKITKK